MNMDQFRDFNERFFFLAKEAKKKGHCRSEELGNMVNEVVNKAMAHKFDEGHNLLGYSDDIKLEMFGNSVLAIYNAIINHETWMLSAAYCFNYMYTTTLNECRMVLLKFYRDMKTVSLKEEGSEQEDFSTSVYAQEKKLLMKGVLRKNEALVNRVAQSRKVVRLQKVIRLAVDEFLGRLNKRKIEQLIIQARKVREAAC